MKFLTTQKHTSIPVTILLPFIIVFIAAAALVALSMYMRNKELTLKDEIAKLESKTSSLQSKFNDVTQQLDDLKKIDQKVRNDTLESEIQHIQVTYNDAMQSYEDLLRVKEMTNKTEKLDQLFAETLTLLSKRNYASASANIKKLTQDIQKLKDTIAASLAPPATMTVNNAPPGGGYSRQLVSSDVGNFIVDIISGDLSTTRVIVDSASDSTCGNDCPVLSLGEYVSRNGGYAGINGSYFCPSTYPSCQDKKNSFDTLLMNVRKNYLNGDNNVYSTVPAVIFLGGSVRFVGRSLEWGRDTGNDGVLANQPLLLMGGNIQFSGNDDPKMGSKGPRCFVGNKANVVYIGCVQNATLVEGAHVLKALGIENAINLDSGGSTALYYNGYKLGPGRNIPNAIVFVRR